MRKIRIGQPVTLTADLYGKKVEYHGKVQGLGVGTGSAFALLPAQNATGNWIKVVQRVPVRIALDPKEIARNPLRVGLSMNAEVDVSNQDGKTLADAPRAAPVAQTQVYQSLDSGADAEVRRVIAANLGARATGRRQGGAGYAGRARHFRGDRPHRFRRPLSMAGPSAVPLQPLEGSARVWGTDRAVGGDLHERAGHVDRQRVAAGHRRRPRCQPQPGHLGHHQLRGGERHRLAA